MVQARTQVILRGGSFWENRTQMSGNNERRGGLGDGSPGEVQGQSPGGGSGGRSPPEVSVFLYLLMQFKTIFEYAIMLC